MRFRGKHHQNGRCKFPMLIMEPQLTNVVTAVEQRALWEQSDLRQCV